METTYDSDNLIERTPERVCLLERLGNEPGMIRIAVPSPSDGPFPERSLPNTFGLTNVFTYKACIQKN